MRNQEILSGACSHGCRRLSRSSRRRNPKAHRGVDLEKQHGITVTPDQQPSDEADRIRYYELSRIFQVILDLTDYYVQGGKKPKFVPPAWFATPGE